MRFKTVTFDDFNIAIGSDDDAFDAVKVGRIRMPITLPESPPNDLAFIGYKQHIRLDIKKDIDSRVIIMADLAASAKVIEFADNSEFKDYKDFTFTIFSTDDVNTQGSPATGAFPNYSKRISGNIIEVRISNIFLTTRKKP